jgi:acetyl-CoA C-acetyltransferase
LVVGAEKTSDALPEQLESIRAFGLNASLEAHFGFTPSIGAALGMKAYLKRYNLEHSMFYHLARTAHEHAVNNPYAIFPFKLNESQYLKSPVISTPLTVMDTAPPCDGAAAVMLVKEELNSENKNKGIYILSSSSITVKPGIPLPVETLELPAVQKSVHESLDSAKLAIDDIALFEFHDSNSFFSALSIESAGLSKKGEVLKDAADGKFLKNGKYPLWSFGGNKARGNTIGATGIYQAVEACNALNKNSLSEGKKNALIQSLGSFGAQAITHIIGKL